MLNIGPQELILVLIVALLVVGPQRLPELSRQIGRGLREFRKLQDDVKGIVDLDEVKREVKGMVTFDDATETRRPSSNATAAPSVHRAPRPVSSPAGVEEQPTLEAEPLPPGSDRSADAD